MEKINQTIAKEREKNRYFRFFVLIFAFYIVMNVELAFAEDVEVDKTILNNAALLLKQKEPHAAYELLEKYEDEYAGWWEYDYLLGVAALESGQSNLAIFALQRSLTKNPNLMDAHVDLGRAYFEVNELVPARAEFEWVLKSKPIKTVASLSQHYLRLIDNKSSPIRFSSKYHFETKGGYGSNATAEKIFDEYTLFDENIQTPSRYLSLKVNTSMFIKMDNKNSVSLNASLTQRENQKMNNVNFMNSNAQILWSYKHKFAQQTLGVQFSKTDVAERFQAYATGLNMALKFRLIIGADFGINVGFTKNDFSGSLKEKNSLQTILGTNISKKSENANVPSINLSIFVGENTATGTEKSGAKTLSGARVGLQYHTKIRIPVVFNLSSQILYTSYKEKQLEKDRSDTLIDVSLLSTIEPWKLWETSVKLAYTKNTSDVELYNYGQMNSYLSIKRYF